VICHLLTKRREEQITDNRQQTTDNRPTQEHTTMLPLIPQSAAPSVVRNTAVAQQAPSAPGLPDTFRAGGPAMVGVAATINNRHPIESRIATWEQTQAQMHAETRRRMHGIADPVKRDMELELVTTSELRPGLVSSNIHSDILRNKDTSIDWEDVYSDGPLVTNIGGARSTAQAHVQTAHQPVHAIMEQRLQL
jgi:proteasome maturation protein